MQRLGIGWRLTSQSGAGVLAVNLAFELLRSRAAIPVPLTDAPSIIGSPFLQAGLRPAIAAWENVKAAREKSGAQRINVEFPVLHSVGGDMEIHPKGKAFYGQPDYAVALSEIPIFTAEGRERAKRFTRMVTFSTWMQERYQEAGFDNILPWNQGVDLSLFHPAPRLRAFAGRFVVLSAGKPELRKGQDLVITAFKRFHARRPEALLLTTWYNPWPSYSEGLAVSPHIKGPPPLTKDGAQDIEKWLLQQGLPAGSFLSVGRVANADMPSVIREADVALFPNRAEAATNFPLMEALACGLPSIVSANSGHLDLLESVPCYRLERQDPVPFSDPRGAFQHWRESDIGEMVELLDQVYLDRAAARAKGFRAAEAMATWSWPRKTAELVNLLELGED